MCNLLRGSARAYVSFAYSVIQKTRPATSDGAGNMRKISTKGSPSVSPGNSRLPPPSLFHHHLLLLLLLREEVATVNTVLESCTIYESVPVPHHRCIAGTINRRVYCQGSRRRRRVSDQQFMKTKNKSLFFFVSKQPDDLFSQTEFLAKTQNRRFVLRYNYKEFLLLLRLLYLSTMRAFQKIGDESVCAKHCSIRIYSVLFMLTLHY